MSVEPGEPTVAPIDRVAGWSRRLGALLSVILCFEIGVFLLVFPWLDPWANNWIAELVPWLSKWWENGFFRGAVSGLGAVNLYISVTEVFRLRRSLY